MKQGPSSRDISGGRTDPMPGPTDHIPLKPETIRSPSGPEIVRMTRQKLFGMRIVGQLPVKRDLASHVVHPELLQNNTPDIIPNYICLVTLYTLQRMQSVG